MTKEEAIERIKSRYDKWALDDKDLEAIQCTFPELTESEDERIVDHIIQILEYYSQHSNIVTKAFVNQDIAWLKEHRINTEGDFARGYDCGYECCLNSHGAEWFEKQKEQKSVEWSEEDEEMIGNIISSLRGYMCLASKSPYYSNHETHIQKEIEFLNSLRPSWKPSEEQKPAEWSEYDEDILNWCISDIERVKHCALQTKPELCDMEINWLKSLRPQSK